MCPPSDAKQRGFSILPGLYILLAFGLSLWLLSYHYFPTPDGVNYCRVGENLFRGRGISSNLGEAYTRQPPFYPVLIGLTSLALKDLEFSAHLVSILAFALTLIPLYGFTRSVYPGKTLHWTCLLYATNGFLLIHSHLTMTEPLFTLLVMIQLLLLNLMTGNKLRPVPGGMLAGLAGGLAYLTRPEGFLFFLAGIGAIILLMPGTLSARLRAVAAASVAFLVFFIPYSVFLRHHMPQHRLNQLAPEVVIRRYLDVTNPGRFLEVKKIFLGLTEDKSRLKMDDLLETFSWKGYLVGGNFALIRSAASSLVPRVIDFSKYLFGGIGFALMGASFLTIPWNHSRKRAESLMALFLAPVLSYLILVSEPRRYIPVFPLFLIWIGHGIERMRIWAQATFDLKESKSILIALGTLLVLGSGSVWYVRHAIAGNRLPIEHKDMGLWIKKHVPGAASELVAAEHPYLHFFSGANYLQLPYTDRWNDLVTYLKGKNSKYFVVGEDLDSPLVDAYRFLLDESKPPPAGSVRRHVTGTDKRIFLYEITG